VIVMCASCSGLNRVPAERAKELPQCGTCKAALFPGMPVSFNRAQFLRAKEKSDQLLIVDYWASWCGPCNNFAPIFERAAQVLNLQAKFIKIDTQAEELLAREMNIRSLPTLAVYRHGNELNRVSGALNLAELTKWLAPYL